MYKATCPACKKENHMRRPIRAEIVEGLPRRTTDREPRPGDVTVCAHCMQVLCMHDDESWRVYTDDEIMAMSDDDRITIQRLQKITAKRAGEERPPPTAEQLNMILMPVAAAREAIASAPEGISLKDVAIGLLRELLSRIPKNPDTATNNAIDLSLALVALYTIQGDLDKEKALAAADHMRDEFTK